MKEISDNCEGCVNYNRAMERGEELFCKIIIGGFLIYPMDTERCPCRSCLIKMKCEQPCLKYNDINLRKYVVHTKRENYTHIELL